MLWQCHLSQKPQDTTGYNTMCSGGTGWMGFTFRDPVLLPLLVSVEVWPAGLGSMLGAVTEEQLHEVLAAVVQLVQADSAAAAAAQPSFLPGLLAVRERIAAKCLAKSPAVWINCVCATSKHICDSFAHKIRCGSRM